VLDQLEELGLPLDVLPKGLPAVRGFRAFPGSGRAPSIGDDFRAVRGFHGWTDALVAASVVAVGGVPAQAAGPATRGYVADGQDKSLVVFDPATGPITERIPVRISTRFRGAPGRPGDLERQRAGQRRQRGLGGHEHRRRHDPGGNYAIGVVFTLDSRRAYVANFASRTLSVIDAGTRRAVDTVPLPGQPFVPAASPAPPTSLNSP
jgi:YVTN family beta-propeller protein